MLQNSWQKRRVRIHKRKNAWVLSQLLSWDIQVSEEGAEGGAPGSGRENPLQAVVQTLVRQLCLWSPWRSLGEHRSPCTPWWTPGWNKWLLEEGCDPWEAHAGSSSWQGLCTHWGRNPSWSCLSLKSYTLWKGPTLHRMKSVRSPLLAEPNCDELTTPLISHLSALLQGKEGENIRTEIMAGKKGGLAGRHLKNCFYFSLHYLDLIGNKLIFPKSSLFCSWW